MLVAMVADGAGKPCGWQGLRLRTAPWQLRCPQRTPRLAVHRYHVAPFPSDAVAGREFPSAGSLGCSPAWSAFQMEVVLKSQGEDVGGVLVRVHSVQGRCPVLPAGSPPSATPTPPAHCGCWPGTVEGMTLREGLRTEVGAARGAVVVVLEVGRLQRLWLG